MNNSVFGKTMESVKNRMELKLTTESEKDVEWFSKLHVKDSRFCNGLRMTEIYKKEIVNDKAICVGASVFDLSKLHLTDFRYHTIHNNFKGKYNLFFSDTDSLVYSIQHDDIYEWIKQKSNISICQIPYGKI